MREERRGRTFPFLSMPNEACSGLSHTYRTFSREQSQFCRPPANYSIWNSDSEVFRWQIMICESVVNVVDTSANSIIIPSRNWKRRRKCRGINNSRMHLRACYVRFPFDNQEHLPFLDVKATWYHASLLLCAFENRFGHELYNAKQIMLHSRMTNVSKEMIRKWLGRRRWSSQPFHRTSYYTYTYTIYEFNYSFYKHMNEFNYNFYKLNSRHKYIFLLYNLKF